MSGTEQVFFLVVVPAAIVAVVWALASIGGPRSQQRYRPGRPYQFTTVWYVANHHRPGSGAAGYRQLTAADRDAQAEPAATQTAEGTTGGASDRW